jgi:nitroimidazol reductase NimA-like FMN-containing flavoprotein (pyridoxamine 5'-phosphate oxidase superfamily)
MRRREKEIQDQVVLEELLHGAPVCRLGLAPGAAAEQAEEPHVGYPFVVPVHFVHTDGRIYVHSARNGRKVAMLGKNPRVCVEIDEYLGIKSADKACDYGSRFRSLIAFGRARIVEEAGDKRRALQLLMNKYSGRSCDFSEREIEEVAIIEIQIEQVTGKQG